MGPIYTKLSTNIFHAINKCMLVLEVSHPLAAVTISLVINY